MNKLMLKNLPDSNDLLNWPIDGIESVKICPVCSGKARRVLHKNMRDRIFFCAPGEWTLHECLECNSAFLDPRPTPETIHLAYQNYYTHQQSERLPPENLNGARLLQRVLANGYKNWRFGSNLQPSSILGVLVAFLMPTSRAILNRQFRHLPPVPLGGRLLDVGFGDGSFLENARSIGWDVVGVDPDIETVENARERGLDVYHGSLEVLAGMSNCFDVITMNHVIEHLYDPVASLRECYRLLKPNGYIWLETPNINSLGYSRFQENWRGLEPPRHLVLFNPESLTNALLEVGFSSVNYLPQPSPCDGIYTLSQRIQDGLDPHVDAPVSFKLRIEIAMSKFFEMFFKSRREFIAMTAIKRGE